jgi:hypothetical protein
MVLTEFSRREEAGGEANNIVPPKSQLAYSKAFFAKTSDEGLSSARVIVPRLLKLVNLRSVVDVGCGTGAWLYVFKEEGVERVCGLDGRWVSQQQLLIPREDFKTVDLASTWSINDVYDLAVSLEVGEHLPHDRADHLIQQLTSAAPVVLFSAALPGQEGTNHVNEQWPEYWLKRFESRGFVRLDPIRRHVWQDPRVAWYYQQNLYLFVHEELLCRSSILQHEHELTTKSALTLVHPKIIREATSLRAAIKRVGTLLTAAVKRRLILRGSNDAF